MTKLYRSPNVIIDAHEWILVVEDDARLNSNRGRRPCMRWKWRPLTENETAWRPVKEWKGPMPKHFASRYMLKFRRHAELALTAATDRKAALVKLKGKPPTAEMVLNGFEAHK